MAQTLPPQASGTAAPSSRSQQARARATRDTILDEATVEFARAGYTAASLARIVERSRVTKGALYFHFASKQDLAVAVVEEMEQACLRLTADVQALGLDALRRLARLARAMLDSLDGPPVFAAGRRLCTERVAGSARRGLPWAYWQQVAVDLLTEARTAGLLRPEVEPVDAGRLVTDMSAGLLTTSSATLDRVQLAERLGRHWELVLAASATDSWLVRWRADGGMARLLEGGG